MHRAQQLNRVAAVEQWYWRAIRGLYLDARVDVWVHESKAVWTVGFHLDRAARVHGSAMAAAKARSPHQGSTAIVQCSKAVVLVLLGRDQKLVDTIGSEINASVPF